MRPAIKMDLAPGVAQFSHPDVGKRKQLLHKGLNAIFSALNRRNIFSI